MYSYQRLYSKQDSRRVCIALRDCIQNRIIYILFPTLIKLLFRVHCSKTFLELVLPFVFMLFTRHLQTFTFTLACIQLCGSNVLKLTIQNKNQELQLLHREDLSSLHSTSYYVSDCESMRFATYSEKTCHLLPTSPIILNIKL